MTTLVDKRAIGIRASKPVPIITDYKLFFTSFFITWTAICMTADVLGIKQVIGFSTALLMIGVAGLMVTRSLRKAVDAQPFIEKRYLRLRIVYFICMTLFMAVIGAWGVRAILSHDAFAVLLSTAIVLGQIAAICTLNYFIPVLLYSQLVVTLVPLMAGLFYIGDPYRSFALLLVPFLFCMQVIIKKLHNNKINNKADRMKVDHLVEQLNNALENMPHGICMFDCDGKLEVSNQYITQVVGRTPQSLKGMNILNLVKLLEEDHAFSSKDADLVREWITSSSSRSFSLSFEMKTSKIRYIKFRGYRMENKGIIATFEDITYEMQTSSKIDRLTRFDHLTGLLNREELSSFIDEKLQQGCEVNKCGVILINVNSFKNVNKVMGHRIGDSLLCAITKRLSRITNGMATCARSGDDEFVVVLSGEHHEDFAVGMADLIHDQMDRPFNLNGNAVHVEFSIGIALQTSDKCDSETLLRRAKIAMTVARDECDGWRLFNDEMDVAVQRRRQLEEDLRLAVKEQQFETYFQPLVNISSSKVTVCESLLRWNHPDAGMISPDEFIPIAENMGLINEIGAWVLMESCKTCTTWPEGTRVAVNLSPRQFEDGKLYDTVCNILEITGLEPNRLELEITESLMLSNMHETVEVLKKFKKMGIYISLDDFGTGYSSLNYMHDLPLDKVKIDRSFIMGLDESGKSMTLVQAITGLSHNLGLRVVVEGVETEKQLDILLSNVSVDEIQGYLLSRPLPKDQTDVLLSVKSQENKDMVSKLVNITSRAA